MGDLKPKDIPVALIPYFFFAFEMAAEMSKSTSNLPFGSKHNAVSDGGTVPELRLEKLSERSSPIKGLKNL